MTREGFRPLLSSALWNGLNLPLPYLNDQVSVLLHLHKTSFRIDLAQTREEVGGGIKLVRRRKKGRISE